MHDMHALNKGAVMDDWIRPIHHALKCRPRVIGRVTVGNTAHNRPAVRGRI